MPSELPIHAPGGYVPRHALSYTGGGGAAIGVSAADPLPVAFAVATPPPVTGSLAASGTTPNLAAVRGVPAWVTLTGVWSGSVAVQHSTDGGTTWSGLTIGGEPWAVFTGNVAEPVLAPPGDAVLLRLSFARASGTLSYRIAQ